MSKPVADLIFGEGSTNIILKKPWSPSTGLFPTSFSEGFVYIAEDDGVVNAEEFTEGDSIIYKDGAWIRFGSASGGGGVALETYTPTTTDVYNPPSPVTDGTYNGKSGAKVVTYYGTELAYYPAPPINANFSVTGNTLSVNNGSNTDGIAVLCTDDAEYPPITIDVPVAAYFSINVPTITNTYNVDVMFGPKMDGFDGTAIMGAYSMASAVINVSSAGGTFAGSPFGAITDQVGDITTFTGVNNFGVKYTLRADETMDVEVYQEDMSTPVLTFTIIETYSHYYGELDELAIRKGTYGISLFLNSDNSETFVDPTFEVVNFIDVPVSAISGAQAHWNGEGTVSTNDPIPSEKYSKILELVSPPASSDFIDGEIVITDEVGDVSTLSRSITGVYTPLIVNDVATPPDGSYNGTFFEIGMVENTTGILNIGNFEAVEGDVFGISPDGTVTRGFASSEVEELSSVVDGRGFGQVVNVTNSNDLITTNTSIGNTHEFTYRRPISSIKTDNKEAYTTLNYYGRMEGDNATSDINDWELDKYFDVFNGIDILSSDGSNDANGVNNSTGKTVYRWEGKPMLNIPVFNNTFLSENTNDSSGVDLVSGSSTDVITNKGIVIGDNNHVNSYNFINLLNGAIKGESVNFQHITDNTTASDYTSYSNVTTTTDGSGTGLTLDVGALNGLYKINYYQDYGSDYVDGDTITVSAAQLDGSNDFVFKIYNTVNGKPTSSNADGGYIPIQTTTTAEDVYPYVEANLSGGGSSVQARIKASGGSYTIDHWVNKGTGLSIGSTATFSAGSLDGSNDFVIEVADTVDATDTRRMTWGKDNFIGGYITVPTGVSLIIDCQGYNNETTTNTFQGNGNVTLNNVGKGSNIPTPSLTGIFTVNYTEDATGVPSDTWVTKSGNFTTDSDETYILDSSLTVTAGTHSDGTVLKFLIKQDPATFIMSFSGFGVTINPAYRDYITLTKVNGLWYKS